MTDPVERPARHAHRFATYPGDVAAALLEDPLKGPNAFGEGMVVVYAHYDPVEGVTRAGFAFATQPDVDAAIAKATRRLMPRSS